MIQNWIRIKKYTYMKVIDFENQVWFLFEHEGKLFLDCNHSALGYGLMIELNFKEIAAYKDGGNTYISKLARDIHCSDSVLDKNSSLYKGRDITNKYSDLLLDAVRAWRQSQ